MFARHSIVGGLSGVRLSLGRLVLATTLASALAALGYQVLEADTCPTFTWACEELYGTNPCHYQTCRYVTTATCVGAPGLSIYTDVINEPDSWPRCETYNASQYHSTCSESGQPCGTTQFFTDANCVNGCQGNGQWYGCQGKGNLCAL